MPADKPAAPKTGRQPDMLQDDSRELSRWLASKPDARLHAREAAAAIASAPAAPTGEREALHEVALRINRLILMSAAKARQTADDPPEDRITDADIDRAEAELLAHIRAAVSAPVAAQPAASGVDALWVERAMELATDFGVESLRAGSRERRDSIFNNGVYQYDTVDIRAKRERARDALRTHLSTALTGAQPAPAAPTKQGRALPNPGSPEASAMLDSLLAEYQWPANSKNAARAGWEAANRWLSVAPAAPSGGMTGPTKHHLAALVLRLNELWNERASEGRIADQLGFCRVIAEHIVRSPEVAPDATDAEHAAWLADKTVALGDYAKEAAGNAPPLSPATEGLSR